MITLLKEDFIVGQTNKYEASVGDSKLMQQRESFTFKFPNSAKNLAVSWVLLLDLFIDITNHHCQLNTFTCYVLTSVSFTCCNMLYRWK